MTTTMSKAIFVLDEMPECCLECDLELHVDYGSVLLCIPGDGDGHTKTLSDRYWNEHPDWCPLREMPPRAYPPEAEEERKKIRYGELEIGWNACLDAIEGK